ncbi:MAG: SBBP repeat-containing protein, partial [Acidimicrobiia bacterium]|nr:SBBP repeat-containing protein [Acidimicrobiia bacterium]
MIANRRAVPQPLLAQARSLGTVLLVIGIVAQSLAIFEGPAAAADAPVLVGHTAAGEDTVAIPHGEEGDLLVLRIIHDSDESPESPAGWELVQNQAFDDALVDALLTRTATASEPAEINLDGDGVVHAEVFRFAGVDVDQPIAAISSLVGESDTATAPDLPIDDPVAMVIVTAAATGSGEFGSPPAMTAVASGSSDDVQWLSAGETVSGVTGSGVRQFSLGAERPWTATTLIVRPPQRANTPPVPDAGGPYSIVLGEALELDASATTDADDDQLIVTWDINGDGDYSDAVGETPMVEAGRLAELGVGEGTGSLSVLIHDGTVGVVESSTLEVRSGAKEEPAQQRPALPDPRPERESDDPSWPEADVDLIFEPNLGQFDPEVDFIARGGGFSAFLSDGDAVLALGNGNSRFAIRMRLIGANEVSLPVPQLPLPGVTNYFIGNDPREWQTKVPTYSAVEYQDVYSDIDLRYVGNDSQLQYDFIVQPGADPSQIALEFDGSRHLAISDNGDLEVGLNPGRTVTFSAPVTYQDIDGQLLPVDSAYAVAGNTVSFTIGDHDPSYPLIIDPTLQYGSYLGGAGSDSGSAITVDGSGNIIVGGYSASSDFPVTVGAYDQTANTNNDVTVTKLSADGSTLMWSTYLGGSGLDNANDIAIDGSGNVYVGVYTASSNFPTTAGAFDTSLGGTYDGAVAKLSANGASLLYSTYLGGSGANDYLRAIAVDASGQAVVAGYTDSNNFPMVGGSYDTSFGGTFDAFVTKINTTGTGLVWSTYIGGTGSDSAEDMVLDGSGTVYLTGQAASGFPTTAGAYDSTVSGTFDGHATKLSSNGSTLLYATVFGGSGNDKGTAIAAFDATTLYVGGNTPSSDFPTTAGAYDRTKSSSDDMFVLSLDLTQTGSAQLDYSTFIGGAGFDRVNGIDVDASNRAHVAGWTQSSGLATAGAYDTTLGGSSDGVLAILSADGTTMEELTYLGGATDESAEDVRLSGGSIYLTGNTSSSTGFPISGGAYDSSLGGTLDGFVLRFAALDAPPDPSVVTVNTTGNSSDNNPGDGVCFTGNNFGNNVPECTLRAAIQEANASGVVNKIHFNIPQTDTNYSASPVRFRIRPSSLLPEISSPVTLDASTQPEYATSGRPVIEVDGINVSASEENGFWITGGGTTVRGFVLNNWGDDAIDIEFNGGNTIVGNYVGTDVTGTTAQANAWGINIKTTGNTVGGTDPADANVVSGNTYDGFYLYKTAGTNNTIQGNFIGTNSSGSS